MRLSVSPGPWSWSVRSCRVGGVYYIPTDYDCEATAQDSHEKQSQDAHIGEGDSKTEERKVFEARVCDQLTLRMYPS